MKTIKSMLALVAAVFIGSSAWAATTQTIPYTFASGVEEVPLERSAESSTTWFAWSDNTNLVSITVEGGSGDGTAENKVTFVGKDAKSMLHLVPNSKKGATSVYLKNELGDSYTVNARVDVVQCVNVELKHCADEADEQGWEEIDPAKFPALVPNGTEANHWGFAHAYSLDEGIAKIKVVDGKFRLYAPADGKDGTTRCIFIKNENDVLENDAKIYMFYVTVSTVELEKFLTFPADEDKAQSNATLNIRAHYLNNVKEEITPKVLFVGSGCTSHNLEPGTIVDSVGIILAKADVDVYLYKKNQAWDAQDSVYLPLKKGQNFAVSDLKTRTGGNWSMSGSNHNCLNAFYDLFYSIATNETKRYQYDYIVMEFDGSRLASSSPTDYANRRRDIVVAEWLNEYYEGRKDSDNARIVWVVDNDESGYIKEWDGANYFRPCSAYSSDGNTGDARRGSLNYGQFRGLLGVLNPWICLENKLFDYNYATQSGALQSAIDAVCPKIELSIYGVSGQASVGETYAHQADYIQKDNLKTFLAERIKVTSYSADITDNVETQGLSFVSSPVIYGTYDTNVVGNADITKWADLTKKTTGMNVTGTVEPGDHNSISGHVDNVTKEFWTWVQIDLNDDGAFRAGALWDADKQKFFRDPNLNTNRADVVHGEAAYTYFYDITDPDNGVDAEATTLADWPFNKLPLAIEAAGVTRVYDGTRTNATVVSVKSGDNDITDATITAIYSADEGKTWSDPEAFDQEQFVNVTNLQVQLIAYKTDYYFTATSDVVTVKITPRTVYVTADYAEKVYDGEPLTKSTFTVTAATEDTGFVGSEGFANLETQMTDDSSITNAGETNNVIAAGATYNWGSGTLSSDYIVKTAPNVLKVTKRPIIPGTETDKPGENNAIAWIRSAVKVYDGIATGVVVGVKGIAPADEGKVVFTYEPTPAPTFTSALTGATTDTKGPKYTDVLNDEEVRTVKCTVSAGDNYIPCTVEGTVLIKRRPITLKSPSKSCQEKDMPEGGLTFTGDEIVDLTASQTGKGYVVGQKFAYSDFARNSQAGTTVSSTFKLADGTAILNNYKVNVQYGKLSIIRKVVECHGLCCDYVEPGDCMVYELKLRLKTLQTAKKAYVNKKAASACGEGSCDSCYYLDQKNRMYLGYLWDCVAGCWEAGDPINFVLWDATNKRPVSNLLVPPANSGSGLWEGDTLSFDVLDRYTAKGKKVEAFFSWEGETLSVLAAGFGTYDAKLFNGEGGLKSASGNAVALVSDIGLTVSSKCEDGADIVGNVLTLCDCYESICDGEEAEQAAASGSWQIKYNSALSKGSKTLRQLVPKYMVEQ